MKRKYDIGQKLVFIDEDHDFFRKGKTYIIQSFSLHTTDVEYRMLRDDGQLGLWWERELDKSFVNLKETRKLKLQKIKDGKI